MDKNSDDLEMKCLDEAYSCFDDFRKTGDWKSLAEWLKRWAEFDFGAEYRETRKDVQTLIDDCLMFEKGGTA